MVIWQHAGRRAGDDLLYLQSGDIASGGAGQDVFDVMAETGTGEGVHITDFDPAEDMLALTLHVRGDLMGGLGIVPTDDGIGAEIRLGADLIAVVTGGQDLTLDDLTRLMILINGNTNYTDGDAGAISVGNDTNMTINGGGSDDWINLERDGRGAFKTASGRGCVPNVAEGGLGNDTIFVSGGAVEEPHAEDRTNGNGLVGEFVVAFQNFGFDTISGGVGDDPLVASNGADMTGDAGRDTFAMWLTWGGPRWTPNCRCCGNFRRR